MISRTRNIYFGMAWLLTAIAIACAAPVQASAQAFDKYSQTIGTLEALSARHITTWQLYKAYEAKAQKENLVEIAALFSAMAASQAVIAARFQDLLVELGSGKQICRVGPPSVGISRDNLRAAIKMELSQADTILPMALKQITGEGHDKAIEFLQQAINAKMHHREKLETIYAYTGQFFGALTASLKRRKPTYFICMRIGTVIVNKLPINCPVHGGPTSSYVSIFSFITPTPLTGCNPG